MAWDKYDISRTSYTQSMDEKTTHYNNLMRKAERINRNNAGKPTKEEANFYYEAAKLCDEIMGMNLSQRAVYEQWKGRKLDCEDEVRRITDILAPPPPPAPKETEEAQTPQRNVQRSGKSGKTASGSYSAPDAQVGQLTTDPQTGFSTRYARKEVPIDMIQSWFREAPSTGFDEVIGREELKERLMTEAASFGWDELDRALGISPVQCYFLYGPPGTGKTHMIRAFASELKKRQQNFKFMQLTGSDIHASYVGVAEKIVTAAFGVAEEQESCLIFIDEIDILCGKKTSKSEGHEQRLTTAFLEAYNKFKRSNKRLVFMGATNHPGRVEEAMLDRVHLIRIPLPTEADRKIFFDQMLDNAKEGIKHPLESGFTTEEMAAATDNHSYRDLERIRDNMLSKLKAIAIRQYRILDEAGNVDLAASDARAAQAIRNGEILLTRAIFEKTRQDNPPSDKTDIRLELQEFEKRIAGNH